MQFVLFKDGAFKKFYSSLKIFPYCFNAIFFMSVSSFVSLYKSSGFVVKEELKYYNVK